MRLGADGASFALSFWLKLSSTEITSQIIGTDTQYAQGALSQGFIVHSVRGDASGVVKLRAASQDLAGNRKISVDSAPFAVDRWTAVAINYYNDADGATFELWINGEERSGHAYADVYNSDLRIGDEGWGRTASFDVADFFAYDRILSPLEISSIWVERASAAGYDLGGGEMLAGVEALEAHVVLGPALNDTELASAAATIVAGVGAAGSNVTLMQALFRLIGAYEASDYGPLFMRDDTRRGFAREGVADGHAVSRAMFAVQQAVLTNIFGDSRVVAACADSLLAGERWLTSAYWPGSVEEIPNSELVHAIELSGVVPPLWGKPVAFNRDPARKPTGMYLVPGGVAMITVPQSIVDAGEFAIRVNAHSSDHSNKATHKRLDRVSIRFEIVATTIRVAHPLGGGIYIDVPYLANEGLFTVTVTGDVVEAPFFSATAHRPAEAAGWNRRRTAPAPWADFETDKFMMQVPRSWVHGYSADEMASLALRWDRAMDGVSELDGYAGLGSDGVYRRNRKVMYLQTDVHIKHGAHGIGYPQINVISAAPGAGPEGDGRSRNWMVTDPTGFEIEWHELGHAELPTMFRGETEAIPNLLHAYVTNVKENVSIDTAFAQSFGPSYGVPGFTPDDAARHWMVTVNFRDDRDMDHSNTEHDQIRYQHRGYAKYIDIARLWGWQKLIDFNRQNNLDVEVERTEFQASVDAFESAMEECVASCNADGYLCTFTNRGGCERPNCAAGCHYAYHAVDEAECEAHCDAVAGTCFPHEEEDYDAPVMVDRTVFGNGAGMNLCTGARQCGAADNGAVGFGNDCDQNACSHGCALANSIPKFYGNQSELVPPRAARATGLSPTDSRIFHLSLACGEDVTPLIHFWGIRPDAPMELAALHRKNALLPQSSPLRDHLIRYGSIIPANNSEFNDFFERVYPGRPAGGNPLYGKGWFNVWRDVWSEAHAQAAQAEVNLIVSSYNWTESEVSGNAGEDGMPSGGDNPGSRACSRGRRPVSAATCAAGLAQGLV